jgi:hypothetical protein
MREYSPKRRTALVLAGSGTAGAYHAGVLKALDESGVKIDVVVGSGAGAVSAAFAAVAGGAALYGPGGFWEGLDWDALYRLRPAVRAGLFLVGCSLGVLLLPVGLAVVAGLLFPVLLILEMIVPGLTGRVAAQAWVPDALRAPYLAALALPVLAMLVLALVAAGFAWSRDRRRLAERFEWILDATPACDRVLGALGHLVRGTAQKVNTADRDLGARFVAVAGENLGQPGFRELVLRTADLDSGGALSFALLGDDHRAGLMGRGKDGVLDLRAPGYAPLLVDAVLTGVLPPVLTAVRRITFPKGGPSAGETHRITDAALAGGCGLSEALAAGADQVIVVSPCTEIAQPLPRRRGPRALGDGILATLERQALLHEIEAAERMNRMVETLGHETDDHERAWQDPATGRTYRLFSLYVVRPERRSLGPLEFDGAQDPTSEVLEDPMDLMEQGYSDAYRLFVEPVVGAGAAPSDRVSTDRGVPVTQVVEL